MSAGKQFILDANVFIQARQRYYAFDICPGFWLALVRQHESSRVCSIDKIKAELLIGHDDLVDWVKARLPETFFKGTTDQKVAQAFGAMVKWVQAEPQFSGEAKAEFASVADGWVLAYAKANGLVVVTHEEYAPDARKKVPIPNICLEFGVDYCDTFEMLRDLKTKFVLKKKRTQS